MNGRNSQKKNSWPWFNCDQKKQRRTIIMWRKNDGMPNEIQWNFTLSKIHSMTAAEEINQNHSYLKFEFQTEWVDWISSCFECKWGYLLLLEMLLHWAQIEKLPKMVQNFSTWEKKTNQTVLIACKTAEIKNSTMI